MPRKKRKFGIPKSIKIPRSVLVVGAVIGGIWLLPKVLKGRMEVIPPGIPQGTKAHTIVENGVTINVRDDKDRVLMQHPTKGRAWIPNNVVSDYIPPRDIWSVA